MFQFKLVQIAQEQACGANSDSTCAGAADAGREAGGGSSVSAGPPCAGEARRLSDADVFAATTSTADAAAQAPAPAEESVSAAPQAVGSDRSSATVQFVDGDDGSSNVTALADKKLISDLVCGNVTALMEQKLVDDFMFISALRDRSVALALLCANDMDMAAALNSFYDTAVPPHSPAKQQRGPHPAHASVRAKKTRLAGERHADTQNTATQNTDTDSARSSMSCILYVDVTDSSVPSHGAFGFDPTVDDDARLLAGCTWSQHVFVVRCVY